MRHAIPALVASLAAAVVAIVPTAQAVDLAGRAATEPTRFGFQGHGYGSRADGGQVPVTSGATAYQVISCTNQAGLRRGNYQARADVKGLGRVAGISTRVTTTHVDHVFASATRNSVTRLHAAGMGGSVNVNAIVSRARAYHDATGFHATANTEVGSIRFVPPGGLPAQTIPVPSPGQSVDIPGVATIYVGQSLTRSGRHAAKARADGVRVVSDGTGSRVNVARAYARIDDGIESGVFNGYAAGSRVSALQGVGGSGFTPLQKMPCNGTGGRVVSRSLANLDLGGQLVLAGLRDTHAADQNARRAHGYEQGQVASVNLGGGQVVAKGIVGRATVTRVGSHLTRSIKGSKVGSVSVNGQAQTFPSTGVIEVPGVVKLVRNLKTRYSTGVRVIALRIKLLDGSGAVVDLGQARMRIKASHR